MKTLFASLLLAAGLAAAQAPAPVVVDGAWARSTVQGQKSSGAFMRLTAREPMRVVGVASPVAGVAAIHEMRMDGDVMRMRAITGLDLPAGKPVELKPGGHHLMLMDLKGPLQAGTQVAVTLSLRNAKGETTELALQVPVRSPAPAPAPAAAAGGGHQHKH